MADNIVAKYHGVNVIESCGYYYPEVNGDIECKTIKEVKEWIENIYLFVDKNVELLAKESDLSKESIWFLINTLHNS